MPKTRSQKEVELAKLVDKFKASKAVIITEFTGLLMTDLDALRAKARDQKVSFQVVKNTLLDKAAQAIGVTDLGVHKVGRQLAVATDGEDEIAISKLIYDFAKANKDKLKIYSGIIENKVVAVEVINQLAELPSREELLAKLVGSLNAPISGFVRVLNGPMQGFYNVIKAISIK